MNINDRKVQRKIRWIGRICERILRLAIKFAMTYGYRMLFNQLGLDMGMGATILAWMTSYWLASKVFAFVVYEFMPPEISDALIRQKWNLTFELYEIIDLITNRTKENP